MLLNSLTYHQFQNSEKEWILEDCQLQKINLIVGRNATGKTKTLNVIHNIAQKICGKQDLNLHPQNYSFNLTDENSGTNYIYNVISDDNKITKEELIIDGKTYLTRNESGEGDIYNSEIDKYLRFKIEENKLCLSVKRDKIQHPFLEPLIEWASNVKMFRFGTDLGKNNLTVFENPVTSISRVLDNINLVGLYRISEANFNGNFKKTLIDNFNLIGYDIEDITIGPPQSIILETPVSKDIFVILIKEKGIKSYIDQFEMSQGMFRAFALILYATYLKLSKTTGSVLIDDIGEGLDFERSSNLVKTIMKISSESEFQILMTTNDRFIMNGIDLKFWSIAVRKNNHVIYRNYQNSQGSFDNFLQLGLNNFDFFSGNFLEN